MNLTQARQVVSGAAHAQVAAQFTNVKLDEAIRATLQYAITTTRCNLTTGAVSAAANNATLSLSGLGSGLVEARHIEGARWRWRSLGAWESAIEVAARDVVTHDGLLYQADHDIGASIVAPDEDTENWTQIQVNHGGRLRRVTPKAILERHLCRRTPGYPDRYAVEADADAYIHPAPILPIEVVFDYWSPLVAWTAGTETPNTVTLNVPDEYMDTILRHGVIAFLRYPSQNERELSDLWGRFVSYLNTIRSSARPGLGSSE